jgi:ABC-type phosphate/phosphonate transport system substrate-binding protein
MRPIPTYYGEDNKVKRSKIPFLACFVCIALISVPLWAETTGHARPKCSIGYSTKSLLDVDIKDATAALSIWTKELGDKEGFETESHLYDDLSSLLSDLRDKKIDMVITQAIDFAKMEKVLNTEPKLIRIKGGKTTQKYLVLVQSESPFKDLREIRNKRLAILKGDELGLLFLNTTLLKERLPEANVFFSSTIGMVKPSQVVLNVFFGQAEACLTTDIVFKTMTELNPQVGQKLRAIATSQELLETVTSFRKDYDEGSRERLIRISERLKDEPRGKQLLLLFKVDALGAYNDTGLDTLRSLLNEYRKLKGRN